LKAGGKVKIRKYLEDGDAAVDGGQFRSASDESNKG